jgi:hypothetical protein
MFGKGRGTKGRPVDCGCDNFFFGRFAGGAVGENFFEGDGIDCVDGGFVFTLHHIVILYDLELVIFFKCVAL